MLVSDVVSRVCVWRGASMAVAEYWGYGALYRVTTEDFDIDHFLFRHRGILLSVSQVTFSSRENFLYGSKRVDCGSVDSSCCRTRTKVMSVGTHGRLTTVEVCRLPGKF